MSDAPRFLVTGGAGFIGSMVVRELLGSPDARVVTLDKLTYAGHRASLEAGVDGERHVLVKGDIRDRATVRRVLETHAPTAVLHLAAETHVDRSIDAPAAFVETNIGGTHALLDELLRYYVSLTGARRERFVLVHVSTDEVFGSLGVNGRFDVDSPYRPNSPYAASKAAADQLVRAWQQTFALPAIITHCSNNYGPRQYPEKLVPLMTLNALDGRPLPVYGDGSHRRDWLHASDHARGLACALRAGKPGGRYLFGASAERSNLELVQAVCAALDDLAPRADGERHASAITHVDDRPGHDRRYAVDARATSAALGWQPRVEFEAGIRDTVRWYVENRAWCRTVSADAAARRRRGVHAGDSA